MTNPPTPNTNEALKACSNEWRKPCEACEGEGTIERTDMVLHTLYSETPEYGSSKCGECDGEGFKWTDEPCSLAECPIGLFLKGGELCLKTEYGNNEGRIDAYIVSSGEFYWGDQPQSIANQRAGLVCPIETDEAISALSRPLPETTEGPSDAVVEALLFLNDQMDELINRHYGGELPCNEAEAAGFAKVRAVITAIQGEE